MRLRDPYILVLLLMTVLFGMTFVSVKYALQGLGVFQVVFGRYVIAFTVLTVIFAKNLRRFRIPRRDWKYFLLLTAIEPVGYFVFETFGLRYTSPASASLIIATIPIFSLVFASFILNEKPGWMGIFGVLICFGGVYFIARLQEANSLAPAPLLGNSLVLLAAMSAGFYNCYARKLSFNYAPLTITYYQSFTATVVFFPLAVWEYFYNPQFYLDWAIAGHVLYLALGGSILAYFLLNHALSRLNAAQVAVFSNLIPVVTITGSYLLFGEVLKPLQFVGALLVLGGIYLTYFRAEFRRAKRRK
jgi:drug/metabolite transporter (DMT)-like permease